MKRPRVILLQAEADSATKIQSAIDSLPSNGGTIVLPKIQLSLDRGIRLRSGVELIGQGNETILKKAAGLLYPLSSSINYGMREIPLRHTRGLKKGMTISIYDDLRRGYHETFAVITWVEKDHVGIDRGVETDMESKNHPRLATLFPLIYGHDITGASVRNLVLDGNAPRQPEIMGSCRGGALYFLRSENIEITGVSEKNYNGDGLSYQMCRDIRVRECEFLLNSGNALHPGSGSVNGLFENCTVMANCHCGIFFCIGASYITVKDCVLEENGIGISIGENDRHNIVDSCSLIRNRSEGILFRKTDSGREVHSVIVRNTFFENNATSEGLAQLAITHSAHDLEITDNAFVSDRTKVPDIYADASVSAIELLNEELSPLSAEIEDPKTFFKKSSRRIQCGYGKAPRHAMRHLNFE